MEMEISYSQFYRYVCKYHPEIADNYPGKRRDMTKALIDKAHALFCDEKDMQGPINDNTTKKLFIVVALLIFDPGHLTGSSLKMRNKLRPMLTKVLNSTDSLISYNTKKAVSEYALYKGFQDEALNIARNILSKLHQ